MTATISRSTARGWGIILCAGVLAAACGRGSPRPRKTHLVVVPTTFRRSALAVADEGKAWAFVSVERGRERLHASNGVGPTFKTMTRLQFAPGSTRLFYWGTPEKEDGVGLLADGKVVMRDLVQEGTLVFSKDGGRWGAVGRERRRNVEEQLEEPVGDDDDDNENDARTNRGPAVVVVDGGSPERAPDVSLPSFSADGRHVAYLEADAHRALTLVVDGKRSTTYPPPENPCSVPLPASGAASLSPRVDARYLADGTMVVAAQDREGWAIFRNAERIASYPGRATLGDQPIVSDAEGCGRAAAFAPSSLGVAPEAPIVAWWERLAGEDERWRVMLDGHPLDDRTCIRWWTSEPPEFSPDGRHVAYPCTNPNGDVFIVFDQRQHGPYRDVWGFTVSDDGQHVAYGASEGQEEASWALYADGKALTKRYVAVWRPRWSPQGNQLAWEASPSRLHNGVLGLGPRKLLTFDDVVWGPMFEPSGLVSWVIRRGRKITRIDMPTS